jgi:undecaprenyl-diphosphatase
MAAVEGESSRVDLAATVVSGVADHGAIVALLALCEGLIRGRSLRCIAATLAAVGIPIVTVNTALKRLVDRPRPLGAEHAPTGLRRPTSSSFPSGHTLASATAAVALPSTQIGLAGGLVGTALVGWSRLRIGAHHPSDVAGGAIVGILLGLVLRPGVRSVRRSCETKRLAD